MLSKGIIVSVQGYSQEATEELIIEIANAGAVAIRTDKKVKSRLPLIGIKKYSVKERRNFAYITPSLEDLKEVESWTKYIAVDYRRVNDCIKEVSDYARAKKIILIADIAHIEDYENIIENDYYHSYIATTLSVLYMKNSYNPDFKLIEELKEMECDNIIAEGNFSTRKQVKQAWNMKVSNVCIGNAISNVFKLTKKFTTVGCT